MDNVIGGWVGVDNWWLNPWTTYDSYWYLKIAADGYDAHTTAFFPLYPLILKFFGPDIISMSLAGAILSHILFFIALILIFRITKKEHNNNIAHITIWTLCFFPAAAFFGAVYTESLFLLLTACTFLCARHKRWALCAFFAALTALTRNPGVLLALALYFEIKADQSSLKEVSKKWYVPCSAFLAFLSVQAFYWYQFGNPAAGVISQEFYDRTIMWPWQPLVMDFNSIIDQCSDLVRYFFTTSAIAITIIALSFIVFAYKRIPTSYIVLIGGVTLMNLVYARIALPSTLCEIRYMGALFPFSQLLAIIYAKANRYHLLGPLLISIQAFMFIIYSYYFGFKVAF